jgi:hypothetical protein
LEAGHQDGGLSAAAKHLAAPPAAAGCRWRREITGTLQKRAAKMLLCCRDVTLAKTGVQEEIGIASDLVKELNDPRFIIPLRLEKYKKLFGIGELQYTNFEGRWADALGELLDALDGQDVPRDVSRVQINPNWDNYRRRHAIRVENAPERLTSNFLRVPEKTLQIVHKVGDILTMGSAIRPCRSVSGCGQSGIRTELLAEAELSLITPHAMQDDGELAGDRDACARHAAALCDAHAPGPQAGPFAAAHE